MLKPGMVASQFQSTLHSLRTRIAVINVCGPGIGATATAAPQAWSSARSKNRSRTYESTRQLVLNGLHDLRMTVPCRSHSDARGKVEKLIPIDISHTTPARLCHHRIAAGVARRNETLVISNNLPCVRPGQGSFQLGPILGIVCSAARTLCSSWVRVLMRLSLLQRFVDGHRDIPETGEGSIAREGRVCAGGGTSPREGILQLDRRRRDMARVRLEAHADAGEASEAVWSGIATCGPE